MSHIISGKNNTYFHAIEEVLAIQVPHSSSYIDCFYTLKMHSVLLFCRDYLTVAHWTGIKTHLFSHSCTLYSIFIQCSFMQQPKHVSLPINNNNMKPFLNVLWWCINFMYHHAPNQQGACEWRGCTRTGLCEGYFSANPISDVPGRLMWWNKAFVRWSVSNITPSAIGGNETLHWTSEVLLDPFLFNMLLTRDALQRLHVCLLSHRQGRWKFWLTIIHSVFLKYSCKIWIFHHCI